MITISANMLARSVKKFGLHLGALTFLARSRKSKYIFIVSPVRSRSTLLNHLLATNKYILSIGETSNEYKSQLNLAQLVFLNIWRNKKFASSNHYFVEQTTANENLPNLSLLKSNNSKFVILLRDPKESVKSMLALAEKKSGWDEQKCISYYNNRLTFIKSTVLTKIDRDKFVVIESKSLIDKTGKTLDKIKRRLKLPGSFSENYNIHPFTGKKGDSNAQIFSGKILNQPQSYAITLELDYNLSYSLFGDIIQFEENLRSLNPASNL